MVDTSDWAGLPDVKIDMDAAYGLIVACGAASRAVHQQCTSRLTATNSAMTDFKGRFSEIFQQNQLTANRDGAHIVEQLDYLARAMRALVDLVPEENERRRAAREWAKKQAEDKAHKNAADLVNWIGNDPPEGPTSPQLPSRPAVQPAFRLTPQEDSGGGGGAATSSARPDMLHDFVRSVSASISSLSDTPSQLSALNSTFNAGFDWGLPGPSGVDGSAVYAAFSTYNQLNQKDKVWVGSVADAFQRAGSAHAMVTISNGALAGTLRNAGVRVDRAGIPVGSPRLYGISPTTGYSDDPVNAATGNFVELETDLVFGGGCTGLVLSRTYNSFNTEVGAFGPGWLSWTEVGLVLGDESALFTHPDGRVSEFPRLGDGWDRALGESLWLAHAEKAGELRVTDNDGETWRFSSTGVAISRDRGEGTLIDFVHQDGRLVRLQHERERWITLTWEDDRVVASQSSDGRQVTYRYEDGHLVSASGQGGSRTYRWNEAGLIAAVIDADGVVEVENTYDDERRVTTQLSPHGRTSRYTYLPGHVTEVADLDGTRSNTWIHDARGRLIGLIDSEGNRQSTAYDQHGNAVMTTERDGAVTVREHDDRGHLIREITPEGADVEYVYDDLDRLVRFATGDASESRLSYDGSSRNPSVLIDPEGGETRFEWDRGQCSRVVDPTGVELWMEHDRSGHLVAVTNAVGDVARLEYDAAGRTVAATTPGGHRTTYVYGPAGLAERHDPDGAVWRFEHTAAGRLTTVIDPTGGRTTVEYAADGDEAVRVDPLGRAVHQRHDDLGNLSSIELPDGQQWRFAHDGLSRLTSATSPDGATWTRRYDAVGQVVELVAPTGDRVAVTTDRATGTSVTRHGVEEVVERVDGVGRELSIERSDGAAAISTYDRCGRVVEQLDGEGGLTRIQRDASGRALAVTAPTGETTRFEYDACGRRTAVVDPLGARTVVEYDADSLPARVTLPTGEVAWTRYDECGRVRVTFQPGAGMVSYVYDLAGRLVETWDALEGLRRFGYDPAGQLVSATSGTGSTTRYGYDEGGRLVLVVDPMGHETRREFDGMDRCVAETDPLGRTTTAGYDELGRQVWQSDAQGHHTEWSYDAAGQLKAVVRDGVQLAQISNDAGQRTLTLIDTTRADGVVVKHEAHWNRRGQLLSKSRDGQTMRWDYDAAGRRMSMTLPGGEQIGYDYDDAGRLAAVDHPLLGRAAVDRDACGRVVGATAGELVQSWSYSAGFVVAHTSTDGEGSTRTEIVRDDTGRIVTIDRAGDVTSYDYDAACQLIAATGVGGATRWRYDACGRVIQEAGPTGSRDFTYDAASQLLSIEDPEGTTRHEYDDLGRRTRTSYADGRTRVLGWSATGWLASILDDDAVGSTTRTELHVDASAELASINGVPVFWDSENADAPPLAQVGTTPVLALGAVSAVGDRWLSTGWRGSRSDTADPWSVLGSTSGAGLPDGVGVSPAGQLTLADLELLGRRVYDAHSRGFLSADPLDPVTGAAWAGNPYSYAGNDPLHALDPTGLKPVSEADLHAAQSWISKNTDYLKGIGVAALGAAALFLPVVGPAVGGALISMGAEMVMERATAGEDGHLSRNKILLAGAFGAVGGVGGAMVKASALSATGKIGANILTQGSVGGASSMSMYAADPGKQRFDGGEYLRRGATGFFGGTLTAGHSEIFGGARKAAGAMAVRSLAPETENALGRLTPTQFGGKHLAEFGVKTVENVTGQAVRQYETTGGHFDLDTYKRDLGKSTFLGAFKLDPDGLKKPAPPQTTFPSHF